MAHLLSSTRNNALSEQGRRRSRRKEAGVDDDEQVIAKNEQHAVLFSRSRTISKSCDSSQNVEVLHSMRAAPFSVPSLSPWRPCVASSFLHSIQSAPQHLHVGDGEEVGVTGRLNRHDTALRVSTSAGREEGRGDSPDAEELSSGRSESDVGSSVEVNGGLGEHGVVLELRAAERGAVTRDEDELG